MKRIALRRFRGTTWNGQKTVICWSVAFVGMNSAGNRSGSPWMSNQRAGLSPINSKGTSKGFRLKRKQKHCLRLSKVRVARGCGSEMPRTGYLESMLSFQASSREALADGCHTERLTQFYHWDI